MNKRCGSRGRPLPRGLEVLFEDRDILVVNKPAGLLTAATERERERTAHHILTEYIRKGGGRSPKKLHVVHRLDRDTSGTLIFAMNEEAKIRLQACWDETKKTYLAVVHGRCEKQAGTITSYLAENKAYNVYSTNDSSRGKLSHTAYRVLKVAKGRTLLEVDLLTGRKNQIRVHLADIGHPIVGDAKYGKVNDPHTRLALHARAIAFRHPMTGEALRFEADIPAFFSALVGPLDRFPGKAGGPVRSTRRDDDHQEQSGNGRSFVSARIRRS